MLYKKIYIYVNVRIVTISLLCLTTGVVHQIFYSIPRDRSSLSIYIFLSLSLSHSPYLSLFLPYITLFLPYITSFFPHVLGRIPLSSPPRVWVMCIYD